MTNPVEPETKEIEATDELPPASQGVRSNPVRALISAAVVREFTGTAEEINKIRSFLDKMERNLEGLQDKVIDSQPAVTDGFRQWLKKSGFEETLKAGQEQGTQALSNIESSLRQYLFSLREKSSQLKAKLEQPRQSTNSLPAANSTFKPEKYQAEEEPIPAQPGFSLQSSMSAPATYYNPAEVPVSDAPARELHVDVFNEVSQPEVIVVAEHPALQPLSVHVTINHDILAIVAADLAGQTYAKEILLPVPVEISPTSQSYRNGVLEIKLKKI